jgi:hypothetical protein
MVRNIQVISKQVKLTGNYLIKCLMPATIAQTVQIAIDFASLLHN